MASSRGVWGIDIGQCALKALRCTLAEDGKAVVAEAFDYIEYPKILSQPEADPDELVRDALAQFLSRNDVRGDKIAISVSGQAGLARFIKLPPVESKKIPDIVKYEARQQIPFALEDVVWDYQPLEGGSQDEGYALETEVGLFAMKRDQIAKALHPLESAGIDVEFIQLAPLAVYNYVCFDRLNNMEGAEPYSPENPPSSKVVLSFGADTTDIVITNGYRVWQRNIPIGGSHFTKALTKELKLTFAKAEHLKKNAKQAEDPRALFKAMRPVFSDLSAEIQRSLTFFMSNNRHAKLDEMLALGNPMKLPGLSRFLTQNLGQKVDAVEDFPGLIGGSVTATPQFEENKLAFATAYGLCVQALGLSQLSTNLLPDEIVTTRLVKAKKPWAIAAAALLLVSLTANFASHSSALSTVDLEDRWKQQIDASQNLTRASSGYESELSELKAQFVALKTTGDNLQSNEDGRLLWLELLKAIDVVVPKDAAPRKRTEADTMNREEVFIDAMDAQQFPDLSAWYRPIESIYDDAKEYDEYVQAKEAEKEQAKKAALAAESQAEQAAAGLATEAPDGALEEDALAEPGVAAETADGYGEEAVSAGPSGSGYVIELTGHHFHNSQPKNKDVTIDIQNEGMHFVRQTLIKNLLEKSVMLPDGDKGEMVEVPLSKLGISYPVIVTELPIVDVKYDPEASSAEEASAVTRRGSAGAEVRFGRLPAVGAVDEQEPERELWKLRRYDFKVQFIWQPTPRHVRKNPELANEAEEDFGV
ncbi:MAG: type IV pilus assembly protein PilM [Planctomycetales bacterium]|nr:type IV pilus assembly protein PilM [Planctomycetales bacterium]